MVLLSKMLRKFALIQDLQNTLWQDKYYFHKQQDVVKSVFKVSKHSLPESQGVQSVFKVSHFFPKAGLKC